MEPGSFIKHTGLRVICDVRLGDEGGKGGEVEHFVSDMKHTVTIGAKGAKSVQKGITKFLRTGEEKNTGTFTTGKSNNITSHSFTGLSEKRSDLGREIQCRGASSTNSFDRVQ